MVRNGIALLRSRPRAGRRLGKHSPTPRRGAATELHGSSAPARCERRNKICAHLHKLPPWYDSPAAEHLTRERAPGPGARARSRKLSQGGLSPLDSPVVFVLVGTRSPGNLGAVCRIAKAFSFAGVRLAAPRMTGPEGEARRLAHGAEDVLEAVRTFPRLPAALEDCQRAFATTGRARDWNRPVLSPRELVARLATERTPGTLALVLGPEDRGLTNEELAACDAVVSVPLPEGSGATLSLPAAAAILAHALAGAKTAPAERPAGRSPRSERGARALSSAELEVLLREIEEVLAEIGFRPRPDRVRFRGSLRDFLARAHPTLADHLVLRHVLAQVGKWKRRLERASRRAAARR